MEWKRREREKGREEKKKMIRIEKTREENGRERIGEIDRERSFRKREEQQQEGGEGVNFCREKGR